ncbi:kinase-like protein, partial [Schizopora paradoxa]
MHGRPGLISLWGDCDLSKYLKDKRNDTGQKLNTLERLHILHKVAQGVNYLHMCLPTIVHGDLKASNIIMVDEEPLLTDFGVSKCLNNIKGYTTGNTYTDDYRAPELQYRSVSLVKYPTTSSDIYAYGCVFFETLSGKAPYDGYDEETRKYWNAGFKDINPADAELQRNDDSPFPFDKYQLRLMKKCFNFHASKRPNISEVLGDLDQLCLAAEDSDS